MSTKARHPSIVGAKLRSAVREGERIQKELDRFRTLYPSFTRAINLLEKCMAENLEKVRALERELAGEPQP